MKPALVLVVAGLVLFAIGLRCLHRYATIQPARGGEYAAYAVCMLLAIALLVIALLRAGAGFL